MSVKPIVGMVFPGKPERYFVYRPGLEEAFVYGLFGFFPVPICLTYSPDWDENRFKIVMRRGLLAMRRKETDGAGTNPTLSRAFSLTDLGELLQTQVDLAFKRTGGVFPVDGVNGVSARVVSRRSLDLVVYSHGQETDGPSLQDIVDTGAVGKRWLEFGGVYQALLDRWSDGPAGVVVVPQARELYESLPRSLRDIGAPHLCNRLRKIYQDYLTAGSIGTPSS